MITDALFKVVYSLTSRHQEITLFDCGYNLLYPLFLKVVNRSFDHSKLLPLLKFSCG
jgi:hypothetical protein